MAEIYFFFPQNKLRVTDTARREGQSAYFVSLQYSMPLYQYHEVNKFALGAFVLTLGAKKIWCYLVSCDIHTVTQYVHVHCTIVHNTV